MFFAIVSITGFYIRIFPQKLVRFISWLIIAVSIAWIIMQAFLIPFQCTPPEYFWDKDIEGSCINSTVSYIATSTLNVFTLLVTLVLPIPVVWKLQMSRMKKVGLIIAFSLGLL